MVEKCWTVFSSSSSSSSVSLMLQNGIGIVPLFFFVGIQAKGEASSYVITMISILP
jgi:hypothetical protein